MDSLELVPRPALRQGQLIDSITGQVEANWSIVPNGLVVIHWLEHHQQSVWRPVWMGTRTQFECMLRYWNAAPLVATNYDY